MSSSTHFTAEDDFSQATDGFLRWLTQKPGVSVSHKIKVEDLRSQGSGRGVVASEAISEDEELFTIPQDVILSFQNSELKDKAEIPEKDLGPWLSLMLAMVYEYLRGEESPWDPYFRVLPTNFDTLMFWSEAELRELKGSLIVNKIGKENADESILNQLLPLATKFEHLFPPPNGVTSFTSEDGKKTFLNIAHRMGSLIMAYAFDIEKPEDEEEEGEDGYVTDEEEESLLPKGMVPLADLLNADASRNNARLFQEDGSLVMKAIKPINPSEEIFNDYGELPRADLLRRYGYVTENYTPYDVVELTHHPICDASKMLSGFYNSKQLEYIDDVYYLGDGFSISRPSPSAVLEESIPEELLMVIQLLNLPMEEFNQLRKKNKVPKPQLNIPTAIILRETLRRRQSEYETSIAEDNDILRSLGEQGLSDIEHIKSPFYRRHKMAVQVRKGEKEILSQLVNWLDEYIGQPNESPAEVVGSKRHIEDVMNGSVKRRRMS